MSRIYSMNKVRQALHDANGDTKVASHAILELCVNDPNFLLGITEPFLRGIIGHALTQATKKTEEDTPKVLNVEELSHSTGLGMDIVKSMVSDGGHKFGTQDRSRSTLGKRPKASQSHVDALKAFIGQKAD